MKINTTKIILQCLKSDYRKGYLSAWIEYEEQPAIDIRKKMRSSIRAAIRSLMAEKMNDAKQNRLQQDVGLN